MISDWHEGFVLIRSACNRARETGLIERDNRDGNFVRGTSLHFQWLTDLAFNPPSPSCLCSRRASATRLTRIGARRHLRFDWTQSAIKKLRRETERAREKDRRLSLDRRRNLKEEAQCEVSLLHLRDVNEGSVIRFRGKR